MKTTKELSHMTGVPYATLQFWKRTGGLLPAPVGQDGRTVLYPDNAIARIQNILEYQRQGKSLESIASMLADMEAKEALRSGKTDLQKLEEEYKAAKLEKIALEEGRDEIESFLNTWKDGNCKEQVCNILNLDPAMTGHPSCILAKAPETESGVCPTCAYVTVRSGEYVYMSRLIVDVYTAPEVIESVKMSAGEYGMMLYVFVQSSDYLLPDPNTVALWLLFERKLEEFRKYAQAALNIYNLGEKVTDAIASQN